MKKIIILLAVGLTMAVSTPLSPVIAQDSTSVVLPTDTCTQAADSVQVSELEEAQAEVTALKKKVSRLQRQIDYSGTITDILSIVTLFGFSVAVVFCWFYFRSKNRRAKYQLIDKMIETGQPNAVELYNSVINEDNKKSRDMLQHGIRMAFVGVGLFFFFTISMGKEMGSIGILVFFIGVGEAVAGYLQKQEKEKRNRKNMPEQTTTAPTEKTQPDKTENPTPEEQ